MKLEESKVLNPLVDVRQKVTFSLHFCSANDGGSDDGELEPKYKS